jgi:23S rRNA-intervening sequence protein
MTEDRQGRLPPVATFEDLEVSKRAYRLSLEVHRRSLGWPAIEQDALADQVRRASKSVCANLAEGFARPGVQPADFRRYLIWLWDRRTRCGCGAAIVSISATSMKRAGRSGVRSIARSQKCCRV